MLKIAINEIKICPTFLLWHNNLQKSKFIYTFCIVWFFILLQLQWQGESKGKGGGRERRSSRRKRRREGGEINLTDIAAWALKWRSISCNIRVRQCICRYRCALMLLAAAAPADDDDDWNFSCHFPIDSFLISYTFWLGIP